MFLTKSVKMSSCFFLEKPIIDVLFNANKNLNPFNSLNNTNSKWDIIEYSNFYLLIADIPGRNINDIKIFIKNNILTIEAENLIEIEKVDCKYHFKERDCVSFNRSMILPKDASDNVSAFYKNGVLSLNIPKLQEISKQIKVQEE